METDLGLNTSNTGASSPGADIPDIDQAYDMINAVADPIPGQADPAPKAPDSAPAPTEDDGMNWDGKTRLDQHPRWQERQQELDARQARLDAQEVELEALRPWAPVHEEMKKNGYNEPDDFFNGIKAFDQQVTEGEKKLELQTAIYNRQMTVPEAQAQFDLWKAQNKLAGMEAIEQQRTAQDVQRQAQEAAQRDMDKAKADYPLANPRYITALAKAEGISILDAARELHEEESNKNIASVTQHMAAEKKRNEIAGNVPVPNGRSPIPGHSGADIPDIDVVYNELNGYRK